jgi:hypothetical protein
VADFPEHPAVFSPNKRPISAKYADNNENETNASFAAEMWSLRSVQAFLVSWMNNSTVDLRLRVDFVSFETLWGNAVTQLLQFLDYFRSFVAQSRERWG